LEVPVIMKRIFLPDGGFYECIYDSFFKAKRYIESWNMGSGAPMSRMINHFAYEYNIEEVNL